MKISGKKVVYLDPGHGGHDPGAVNRDAGLEEAEMALDVCRRAKKLLDPFLNCFLTRTSDKFLSLSERPRMANVGQADAFVSYHFNASSSANTKSSFEGFTTPGQNESDKLCEAILKHHGRLLPQQSIREDRADGDADKEANFAVIRGTRCPSCLIEGEFISTVHGAELIGKPENRQLMAQAVKRGVLEFLGVKESQEKGMEWVKDRLDAMEWQVKLLRTHFKEG